MHIAATVDRTGPTCFTFEGLSYYPLEEDIHQSISDDDCLLVLYSLWNTIYGIQHTRYIWYNCPGVVSKSAVWNIYLFSFLKKTSFPPTESFVQRCLRDIPAAEDSPFSACTRKPTSTVSREAKGRPSFSEYMHVKVHPSSAPAAAPVCAETATLCASRAYLAARRNIVRLSERFVRNM